MITSIIFIIVLMLHSTVGQDCGNFLIDNGVLSARIVGGSNASPGQFPWQVSIQRQSQSSWGGGGGWTHFCGGSIISSDWILTAAHCVETFKWSYTPGSIRVLSGTTQWRQESTAQVNLVSRIVIHDGWNRQTGSDDLALLHLSSPIQLGQGRTKVSTVCLPSPNQEFHGFVTASGWGYTNKNGQTPNADLKMVRMPIVSLSECSSKFQGIIGITDKQVCAGGERGQGDCMGDSGGPLVHTDGGRAIQVGIVSFSIPCAAGYPDVFTRVAKYLDWIQAQTGVITGGDATEAPEIITTEAPVHEESTTMPIDESTQEIQTVPTIPWVTDSPTTETVVKSTWANMPPMPTWPQNWGKPWGNNHNNAG